jgi:hypothetical protein
VLNKQSAFVNRRFFLFAKEFPVIHNFTRQDIGGKKRILKLALFDN